MYTLKTVLERQASVHRRLKHVRAIPEFLLRLESIRETGVVRAPPWCAAVTEGFRSIDKSITKTVVLRLAGHVCF